MTSVIRNREDFKLHFFKMKARHRNGGGLFSYLPAAPGRVVTAGTRDAAIGRGDLLAEFATLHARTAKQLAVLLLRHALTALLDHRTHRVVPRVLSLPRRARRFTYAHLPGRPRPCLRPGSAQRQAGDTAGGRHRPQQAWLLVSTRLDRMRRRANTTVFHRTGPTVGERNGDRAPPTGHRDDEIRRPRRRPDLEPVREHTGPLGPAYAGTTCAAAGTAPARRPGEPAAPPYPASK